MPATINSESGARVMESIANEVVGGQNVTRIAPMMVGEDMAEFLNRAPGCFVLVGAANPEEGFYSPHHSPTFDFEESVMPTGVALLAEAAFFSAGDWLQRRKRRGKIGSRHKPLLACQHGVLPCWSADYEIPNSQIDISAPINYD